MATEKFHYTFNDGTKVQLKRFDQLPFKTLRTLRAAAGSDDAMMMAMFDIMEAAAIGKGFSEIEEQPIAEVTDLLQSWQVDDTSTDAGESEGE